jgi:hypothetical protein
MIALVNCACPAMPSGIDCGCPDGATAGDMV